MMDFFREELELQKAQADEALEAFRKGDTEAKATLTRVFHSLKGACVLVGLEPGERITRALEEWVEQPKRKKKFYARAFKMLDSLSLVSNEEELKVWQDKHRSELDKLEEVKPAAPRPKPPTNKELSVLELFLADLEIQKEILITGLIAVSKGTASKSELEVMMRAAHSLKGAAAMVGLEVVVPLAHAMEDCLEKARQGEGFELQAVFDAIDFLDSLEKMQDIDEALAWLNKQSSEVDTLVSRMKEQTSAGGAKPVTVPDQIEETVERRTLRLDTEYLNELMALSGELEVTTHWVSPFQRDIQALKTLQRDIIHGLEPSRQLNHRVEEAYQQLSKLLVDTEERLYQLDTFERRLTQVSRNLTQLVVSARMRPLADLSLKLSRLVHDLEQELEKPVNLEVRGEQTLVDRDILQRLEPVLVHLIANSIDHGLEDGIARKAAGKPTQGKILIEASHRGGRFQLTFEDDGKGVDPEILRRKVVERELIVEEAAATLSEQELGDFLLLPRFTTKREVSKISGRGVGLDIVREVVSSLGGQLRLLLRPGKGLRFEMTLPVTRSVTRALIFRVGEQLFAIPMARVDEILRFNKQDIHQIGGKPCLSKANGAVVSLLRAEEVLELPYDRSRSKHLRNCVVLRVAQNHYGLVVGELVGRRELVIQKLPDLLGKVQDVSAAATLEDGSVVLLLDSEDLVRTIETNLASTTSHTSDEKMSDQPSQERAHILLVEDSLTVRELQRKILENSGYRVTSAVDGVDGWNALQRDNFDLLVTDIDMPRMDGLTLITKVRGEENLEELPIVVVSYKDREKDRERGEAAGADRYLTKGSFRDQSFLNTIRELLGENSS